jgi:glutaredoxin
MRFLIVLYSFLALSSVKAENFIIPTQEKHSDFLIEPWKPNAANVIVFKDPNCGYCIKALKRLDKYKDYNVFMFWAPILGRSSQRQVEDIFECEKPSGSEVILSVINRSNIVCKKSESGTKNLKELNKEIVENYNPQSVPAYYFGGQKIGLSSLNRFKQTNENEAKPIKLNWQRYQILKLDQNEHQGLANAIVFVSNDKNIITLQNQLKTDYRYNWYIAEYCIDCSTLPTNKMSQELALLFNIEQKGDLVLVINGVIIQPERYRKFNLESLLVSQ